MLPLVKRDVKVREVDILFVLANEYRKTFILSCSIYKTDALDIHTGVL